MQKYFFIIYTLLVASLTLKATELSVPISHSPRISIDIWHTAGEISQLDSAMQQIAVTPGATNLLILTTGGLYSSSQGEELNPLQIDTVPDSIALAGDTLFCLSHNFLGMLNNAGNTHRALPLPYGKYQIAASAYTNALLMFGSITNSAYRLYRFTGNGDLQVLFEIDEPIISVTDTKGAAYAATAHVIFSIHPGKPDIIFKTPEDVDHEIKSIVALPDGGLFCSTDTHVYIVQGGIARSIIHNSGGQLLLQGNQLFVMDPNRRLIYAISPANLSNLINEK